MKPENQVKINCSEMPSVDLRNFCRTFSKALERSAEDPSFMKKYEQYKAQKEVEKQHHEEKGIIDVAADLTDCSFVCVSGRSEQRQGA